MSKIFEVFTCHNGKTQGYRFGEARAIETIERLERAGCVAHDYLPARDGFYVLDMTNNVKAGPFEDHASAQKQSDWQDMCHDYNSFRVMRQTN